jgi:Tfp pilus assembly protein PilF
MHYLVKLRRLLPISVLFASKLSLPGQSNAVSDHLQKAAHYLQLNDADSAKKELNAALALDPSNAEANANLGAIAFFHRDYVNSAEYLGKALKSDPSLSKSEALLGICDRRLGRPAAQSLLEKSFPKLKDKHLAAEAGLELANLYYGEGDLDRASGVMRSLVDLDPDNVEILYMAQRVYSELADDTVNKLTIIAPGSARMQQVIAERLVNEGDLKEAIEHYRNALKISPHLPGMHFELAEAIFESAPNDPQAQNEAEIELKAGTELDGDSAGAECIHARIAMRRSDQDAAYAHYQRAFALNPANAEAQIGLGRVLTTKEKPEQAVSYLRMAVASDPMNDQAHYWLATVCKRLGLKEESDKEFRLFREIKETKERLKDLYRQMNKKPPSSSEGGSENQLAG